MLGFFRVIGFYCADKMVRDNAGSAAYFARLQLQQVSQEMFVAARVTGQTAAGTASHGEFAQ